MEWVFLSLDGLTARVHTVGNLPTLGDDKLYDGRRYQVVAVLNKSVAHPHDLVVACEQPRKIGRA